MIASDVRFTPAGQADIATGLLGWASFNHGSLRIRAAVRRSANGRPYLAFPARRDSQGRRRADVEPLSQVARAELEREVLHAIGMHGGRP